MIGHHGHVENAYLRTYKNVSEFTCVVPRKVYIYLRLYCPSYRYVPYNLTRTFVVVVVVLEQISHPIYTRVVLLYTSSSSLV